MPRLVAILLLTTLACGEASNTAVQAPTVDPSNQASIDESSPASAGIDESSPASAGIDAGPGASEAEGPESEQAEIELRVEPIEFASEDGLTITADLYLAHPEEAGFIVLFHQAGWSRGEYTDIAPTLAELGFNSLAVDLRSGKAVNNVANQTFARAASKKLPTSLIDVLPDMRASLRWVADTYPKARMRVAWGSSSTASLALYLAGTEPGLMQAVLAFAPGEYFSGFGKKKTFIRDAARSIQVPVFVTSGRSEVGSWQPIFEVIPSTKSSFVPETKGHHGSRALWSKHADSESYWIAVGMFLSLLQ